MPQYPIRQPLTIYDADHVRYVAPYGNVANDGYDGWRFPKQTWYQAYESLPAEGGTIYVMDQSYTGKPTGNGVSGQGIRLTGGTLWPGFAAIKPVNTIGVGGNVHALYTLPVARLLPGDPGDVTKPSPEYDVGIWVTNNGGAAFTFQNLMLSSTKIGVRLAVDGNPGISPYTDSQRTFLQTTADFSLQNIAVLDNDGTNQQPGMDFGYVLFYSMGQIWITRPNSAAIDSDMRASILVKAGGGATSQFQLTDGRFAQGGIRYYCLGSTWGFNVERVLVESDGSPLPPAFEAFGLGNSGIGRIVDVNRADYGGGSAHNVQINDDGFMVATQITAINTSDIVGKCNASGNVFAGVGDADPSTPLANQQMGAFNGKMIGDHDGGRFNSYISAARYWNYYPQHDGFDGRSGNLVPQPNTPSGNCIFTASGATGGHGVNTPVADRWGTFTGYKISASDGGTASSIICSGHVDVVPGDSIVVGYWAKIGNGIGSSQSISQLGFSGTGIVGVFKNMDGNGYNFPILKGNSGYWQWYGGSYLITATPGMTTATGTLNFLQFGTAANPVTFCGTTLHFIPAADGYNEAASYRAMMGPNFQGPIGSLNTAPGQQLIAGSLASTLTIAKGSHALNTLVYLEPVYSTADGTTLLGYRPVYTIT